MHDFLIAFGSGIAFGLGVLAGLTIAAIFIGIMNRKNRAETLDHYKRVEDRLEKQATAVVQIAAHLIDKKS